MLYCSVFQMRQSNSDNLWIIFPYFFIKTCCDPSLEPSHRHGSIEELQHMLFQEIEKISLRYPKKPTICEVLFISRSIVILRQSSR